MITNKQKTKVMNKMEMNWKLLLEIGGSKKLEMVYECLEHIENVKEHYQLGMALYGKTLEECEKDRDEEIAKFNEIIETLNK
jgi:hypothetical protein